MGEGMENNDKTRVANNNIACWKIKWHVETLSPLCSCNNTRIQNYRNYITDSRFKGILIDVYTM